MANTLLFLAVLLQVGAVAYGALLLRRSGGASGAWMCLLGAMLSMLFWRITVAVNAHPPAFFNPLIAIWGSICMLAAMLLFEREVARADQAEAQRDALLTSERAARAEAERSSRLKDDFIATLSHELRTPLAAILGWVAVLRHRRARPEDLPPALDAIERNARAQARLVEDLLDVTRMQAGRLVLDLQPLPLAGPVRAALDAVRPHADAKGVALDLEQEDGSLVRGDAGRLEQVANNLLVNAVKFTPKGGRIAVTVARIGSHAALTVSDTGEGITSTFLPQVFGRFRQADGGPTGRHGGLGLGLSIVANLVQLHGGEVSAASDGPGKGATFTVRLPLASPDAPPRGAPPPELEADLGGLRVLLIDDDPDVRASVARMLEQRGAVVHALDSGRSVLDALAAFRPGLMVVDIGMPDEDGYAVLRRVRALPAHAGGSVPAVSLTAHAREEDRARALEAGFQDHLPKPVDVPALISAIRRHTATGLTGDPASR